MTSANHELRSRAWGAIERGGLHFEPQILQAYLGQRLSVAKPFSEQITQRIVECALPTDPIDYSLLDGIPMMSAFACTVADCLYRVMSEQTNHRDEVRHSFSLFIVWSAVYDYICDEDPRLFPVLTERISLNDIESALRHHSNRPLASSNDPPLVRYATSLLEDLERAWSRLRLLADQSKAVRPWEAFVETIRTLYHAELLSRSDPFPEEKEVTREIERVWPDALWVASLSVACTPDFRCEFDLRGLRTEIWTIGRLLSLIDDVVDVEIDWSTKSRNRLLQQTQRGMMLGEEGSGLPWDAILSDQVCEN